VAAAAGVAKVGISGAAAATLDAANSSTTAPTNLLWAMAVLRPSDLFVTAPAAVNTGFTLTLPAAGAGPFHYITNIATPRPPPPPRRRQRALVYQSRPPILRVLPSEHLIMYPPQNKHCVSRIFTPPPLKNHQFQIPPLRLWLRRRVPEKSSASTFRTSR